MKKSQPAPPTTPAFESLLEQLGAAIAVVVEHPSCPAVARSRFSELASDIFCEVDDVHQVKRLAIEARFVLPRCLALLAKQSA